MPTALARLQHAGRQRRLGQALVFVWLLSTMGVGCPSAHADRTLVPLPIFTTDPNERETYGALLAILDEQEGAVRSLLVPQVTWSPLLGTSGTVYYRRILTEDESYAFFASHSTRNQANYTVNYANFRLAQQRYLFDGQLEYNNDRTARFFGLGASSRGQDETNYTLREVDGRFTFGRRVLPALVVAWTERVRYVTIARGAETSLPFLQDAFTGVPGEAGALVWAHRLALTYDTRKSRETPTQGGFGQLFVEAANRALGSHTSFVRYGLEGRLVWPLIAERLVTVTRGLVEWVEGRALPFFELSALGGETTLRGFGEKRFLDRGRILFNVEERLRLFTVTYNDVRTACELALFVEAGRVFHTVTELSLRKTQTVTGVGVRLVVFSQLVAKIDVGFGSEGVAIFSGLDYPF
jgi:outer membrane protein assembly factor BamA